MRFVDPDVGHVRLGGDDVRGLRQRDVRATVTLDAQDAHLFSTSIVENVRLARPDATDDEIGARCATLGSRTGSIRCRTDGTRSSARPAPSCPEGNGGGSPLRERSWRVPVLVLDEPTAHLDPANAEAVVADALAAADGRSVVLITHGIEGLDAVDEIVTLRRGRIVSAGVGSTGKDDEEGRRWRPRDDPRDAMADPGRDRGRGRDGGDDARVPGRARGTP